LAELYRGFERVLESDFGKTALAQCQARAWRAGFDFRLCAHAAAGLYRPAEAAKSNQAGSPAAADLCAGGCRFCHGGAPGIQIRPTVSAERDRVQARLCQGGACGGFDSRPDVRIYGFEATGNGSYDIEAGLEYNKHGRAITTALGYNQLLATNSVEILAEKGDEFVKQVQSKSALASGAEHQSVDGKIDVLRRMVAFARGVPDAWGQHEILANTPKGLAVHALNLDLDVGPMLQTQKLLDSIVFARRKGFSRTLTAAELEMMNLTGDGNGFDMVTMPLAWRDQVPTANFFRPSGYADNPVAQRNNVVAKLIAATDERMDEEIKKPGARELAAYLQ
jgi:hypothetical protein